MYEFVRLCLVCVCRGGGAERGVGHHISGKIIKMLEDNKEFKVELEYYFCDQQIPDLVKISLYCSCYRKNVKTLCAV